MALLSATSRLKAAENYQHFAFKSFIFRFIVSLRKWDRDAFRFWCIGVIPRGKLDIDVRDDCSVLRLIERLRDECLLWYTDMSFLKGFLRSVERRELLKELEGVELRLAIDSVLENYGIVRARVMMRPSVSCGFCCDGAVSNGDSGASRQCCCNVSNVSGQEVCANVDITRVVRFLAVTQEANHEKISQVMERLNQVDLDRMESAEVFENVINEYPEWSTLTVLMVVLGELYPSISVEFKDCCLKLLAEWMLEHGGLNAFEDFIRGKHKVTNRACTLSSLGESLKEQIRLIGCCVDSQLSS